ncbi:MAG: A/G-specific adenine glycosylase [Deltaproteobacteria bacterium]|nr:MAG: A/G-specific adenine glycosylase [Deltaproteobacteria bacterium]
MEVALEDHGIRTSSGRRARSRCSRRSGTARRGDCRQSPGRCRWERTRGRSRSPARARGRRTPPYESRRARGRGARGGRTCCSRTRPPRRRRRIPGRRSRPCRPTAWSGTGTRDRHDRRRSGRSRIPRGRRGRGAGAGRAWPTRRWGRRPRSPRTPSRPPAGSGARPRWRARRRSGPRRPRGDGRCARRSMVRKHDAWRQGGLPWYGRSAMSAADLAREPSRARDVARRLARWFARHARDLPFRRTQDPYAIWVSEIMLQQTRVETVLGYFERFLARFPTVEALAAASEDDVLAAWSGLGYYRRARLLHRGAKAVVERFGGVLPADPERLREISGIGPYTAGAVASIAYDLPVPAVDGNVARVVARLDAISDPAEQQAGHPGIARRAEAVLAAGRPRVLTQALMELGALVCTPKAPSCDLCPVASACRAGARDLQAAIPAPRKKVAQPEARFVALVLSWRNAVVLTRRPATGLLAGLWCPPLVPTRAVRRPRSPRTAMERLGFDGTIEPLPGPWVRHVFTHRIWHVAPFRGTLRTRPGGEDVTLWRPGSPLPGGLPRIARKVLEAAGISAN